MRMRPAIGWGVFLLLIAIIANHVPAGLGSFYFIKGKRLAASGDHQSAVQAYQQSINSDPNFARTYVELGTSYLNLEKYAEAEGAFKQATAIDDDSCARCGLGMVYHRQGRENEAVRKELASTPQIPAPTISWAECTTTSASMRNRSKHFIRRSNYNPVQSPITFWEIVTTSRASSRTRLVLIRKPLGLLQTMKRHTSNLAKSITAWVVMLTPSNRTSTHSSFNQTM